MLVTDFARVCEQSTDFHFPTLEQQLEQTENWVLQGNDWRSQRQGGSGNLEDGDGASLRSGGSDRVSLKSTTSSGSDVGVLLGD